MNLIKHSAELPHEQLMRKTHQQYILNKVIQALNSTTDEKELFWLILHNVVNLMGGEIHASIGLIEGNYHVVKDSVPVRATERKGDIMMDISKGITGHVIRTKKPYLVGDVTADPFYMSVGDDPFVTRSELAVPVMMKGEVLGVLNLEHKDKDYFTRDDVEIMSIFANSIGVSLTNARLYKILKASEEKYRTLVDQSIAGIYMVKDYRFLYVNPAFVSLFGYTSEEMIGMDFHQLMDDSFKKGMRKAYEELDDHKKINELRKFTFRGIKKNGDQIDIEGHMTYIEYLGTPVILGYVRDVTKTRKVIQALQESEKKYAALVQRANDGIVIVQNEKFVFANQAFCRMMGREEKDLVDQSCFEVLSEDAKQKLQLYFAKSIEERLERTSMDLKVLHKTGRPIYWTATVAMIEYLGKVAYMFVIRDDTKRRHLEERILALNRDLEHKVKERTQELTQANKQLNQAMYLKSRFIADASHELRTPLTILKGNVEIGVRTPSMDEDLKEALQTMNQEIDHMSHILSDLSLLTKADSVDQHHLPCTRVSLPTVLETAVRSVMVLAKKSAIDLQKLDIPSVAVWANEEYLERLFINLLSNAIKYGKEQDGFVQIGCVDKGKQICIFVKDNGIGIPKKELPSIFERFFRGQKARIHKKGDVTGSGLGLSICQWIVQAHQGRIYVESQEDVGTTFFVDLPKMLP